MRGGNFSEAASICLDSFLSTFFQGMIASHDFERKVDDVKKYLERGDVVKVS